MSNIYLDENLSEYISDAFNSLNAVHFPKNKVFSTKKAFGKGVPDEVLIPLIGKEKGTLITCDNRIRITSQFELCKMHNLFIFFILPRKSKKKRYKHWDLVRVLFKHWEKLMNIIKTETPPVAYVIKTTGGLEKIP